MGLSHRSTGVTVFKEEGAKRRGTDYIVALAGNPNTGKSTVFNALTGLNQHTGNWPGKTVLRAEGYYKHQGQEYLLIDLPGTYSLFANSVEEQVARDFICFGNYQVIIVVVDATCLERNLNLALQVLEMTSKVVICVNLLDEAKRKGIKIDLSALSEELGVPVVGTNAREGVGLEQLKTAVKKVASGSIAAEPRKITYDLEIESAISDLLTKIETNSFTHINPRWLALRLLEGEDLLQLGKEAKNPVVTEHNKTKVALLEG